MNVPSGSMRPALEVGDYIFAVTKAFENRNTVRGEIAVYWNSSAGANFVGCIVGLPGDRIQIRSGILHINDMAVRRKLVGEEPESTYGRQMLLYDVRYPNGTHHRIAEISDTEPLDDTEALTVRDRHVFVMGDNRDNSNDSRSFGPVPIAHLTDKPVSIFWSRDWSRIGMVVQ